MAGVYGIVQSNLTTGDSAAFPASVTSGNLLVAAFQSDGNIGGGLTPSTSSSSGLSTTISSQSGDLIVVWVQAEGSVSGASVTDTRGTTYTLAVNCTTSTVQAAMFYGQATSTGSNTITATGMSTSYARISAVEFAGSGVLDSVSMSPNSSTSPALVLPTAYANELIVAGCGGYHSNCTFAPASGFIMATQGNGSDGNGVEYTVASSAGSQPVGMTFTSGGSDNSVFGAISFVFTPNGHGTPLTISDTRGTTYTLAQSVAGSPLSVAVWYGTAPSSGANTVTVTGGPNNYDRLSLVEITGATATLDASVGHHSTNGIPGDTFPPIPSSVQVTTSDTTIDYGTTVGTSLPFPIPHDNVRARWEGDFIPSLTGLYTMGFNVDDSARLVIGGSVDSNGLVVGGTVVASNAGGTQGANNTPNYTQSGAIYLTGGTTYHLILDYANGGGGYEVQLLWTPPGGSVQIVPSSVWVGGTIQGKWWNSWYSWPPSSMTSITTTQSDIILGFVGSRGGGSTITTGWSPNFSIVAQSSISNQETTALVATQGAAGTYTCVVNPYNYYNNPWSCPVVLVAFPSTTATSDIFVPEVNGYAVLERPVSEVLVSQVGGYIVLEKPVNDIVVSAVSGYAVMVTAGSEVVGGIQLETDLPNGSIGVPYNITIDTTNGTSPFTFQVLSGALPNGLSLNASTGVISGTPTTANIYLFQIFVTDVNGNQGSEYFRITISASSGGASNYGFSF